MSKLTDPLLPPGQQVTITWGIPDDFGGMTSALMHRARSFVEVAHTPVTIVTFEPRADTADAVARLRSIDLLAPGVDIQNIYDHWRLNSGTADPTIGPADPIPVHDQAQTVRASNGASMTTWTLEDQVVRREHARADGSTAVTETVDRRRPGPPRRRFTSHDADGVPTQRWSGAWAFYSSWMNHIVGNSPTFAIIDSKTAARFMLSYSHPELVRMHVLHNSHLDGSKRPYGPLRASREQVLAGSEAFDALVFLTSRQRDDFQALLGPSDHHEVIPNGRPMPPLLPAMDRSPWRGVLLASLTPRKRLDHALRILAAVRTAGKPATLSIFGSGPERVRLEQLARSLGLTGSVEFCGHVPNAAAAYADASWTLLTSEFEGSPLVLTEALSRGCIPICYDIPYGPGDVIQHRSSGFLVQASDVNAAAQCLDEFLQLSEHDRARMRTAAIASAQAQSDYAIVTSWGGAQRRAVVRARQDRPASTARLKRAGVRYRRALLSVTGRIEGMPAKAQVWAELLNPKTRARVRRAAVRHGDRVSVSFDSEASKFLGGSSRLTLRFIVGWGSSTQTLAPSHMLVPDTRTLKARIRRRARSLLGFASRPLLLLLGTIFSSSRDRDDPDGEHSRRNTHRDPERSSDDQHHREQDHRSGKAPEPRLW